MSAPVLPSETPISSFADHAFGAAPARSAAELPEPRDALEIWWQAVALGGAGHYAAARAALRRLRIATTDPVLLSLAASTEGSLRRQLGRHARAAHDDGYAAALVLPRLRGPPPGRGGGAGRPPGPGGAPPPARAPPPPPPPPPPPRPVPPRFGGCHSDATGSALAG
ncbi:hypothetical protein [Nocardia carnea]|uniref:hypothetical protein n=1 Tax=Nocardia carnea TaxID=37328 RepID=UPI002456A058|nr:hypothetical protein [Nocardia carnea]